MFKKATFALILTAICLSLATDAEAGRGSASSGPGGVSGMDLGSGR